MGDAAASSGRSVRILPSEDIVCFRSVADGPAVIARARVMLAAGRRQTAHLLGVLRYDIGPAQLAPVRFVIFGRGRSGSTTLVSLLDAVPGLRCEGEILNQRVLLPRAEVRARCARSTSPVYGCKILSYQVRSVQPVRRREDFIRRLAADGFRVVYLRRDNLVEHAVSNIRAREFGFQRAAGSVDVARSTVVDADDLLSWVRESEALARFEGAALAGVPHLSLTYERDLADPGQHRATLLRVCDFLGLPTDGLPPTASAFDKVSPRSLRDSVSNLDEIEARLRGTPYAGFLD